MAVPPDERIRRAAVEQTQPGQADALDDHVSQGIVREVVAVSFGILDEQTAGHRVLEGLDGLDLVAPTDLPNRGLGSPRCR